MKPDEANMTYRELRDKYIKLAREKELAAVKRKGQIRERVMRELENHPLYKKLSPQQFNTEVDIATNTKCAGSKGTPGDPQWGGFVAENQWFTQYAIMYGAAAQEETMRRLTATMESLERYLRSK
jgi:hypothetical protein